MRMRSFYTRFVFIIMYNILDSIYIPALMCCFSIYVENTTYMYIYIYTEKELIEWRHQILFEYIIILYASSCWAIYNNCCVSSSNFKVNKTYRYMLIPIPTYCLQHIFKA